jgi:putative FmdB family regulatory protein
MPTYAYACDTCGHEFEREQRITEEPLKNCPECGKPTARRMIAGTGFILKGGGWESDLYSGPSNRSKTTPKTSESSPSSPAAGSGEGSSSKASPSAKPDA